MQKSIDVTTLAASYLAFGHKEAVSHRAFDEYISYFQGVVAEKDLPFTIEVHSTIEIKGKPYFLVGRLGIELADDATLSNLHRTYLTELDAETYNFLMNTTMQFCRQKVDKNTNERCL